jgi:hypothetical protein
MPTEISLRLETVHEKTRLSSLRLRYCAKARLPPHNNYKFITARAQRFRELLGSDVQELRGAKP